MSALKSWLSKSYSDTGRVIAKTHIEGSAGTLVMRPSAARNRVVGPERDDDEHDDRDHRRPERRTPSRRDTVEQRHGEAPDETEVESGPGTMRARSDPGPRSYPVRSRFARQNVYWSWAYRNWMSFDVPVSSMYGPAKK
jgi:hypothetical protein